MTSPIVPQGINPTLQQNIPQPAGNQQAGPAVSPNEPAKPSRVLNPTVQNYSINKTVKDTFKKTATEENDKPAEKKPLSPVKIVAGSLLAIGAAVVAKKYFKGNTSKAITNAEDLGKYIEDLTKFVSTSTGSQPVSHIKIQFPIKEFLSKSAHEIESSKIDDDRLNNIAKSLNGVFEVMRRHATEESKIPRLNVVLSESLRGKEKDFIKTFEYLGRSSVSGEEAIKRGFITAEELGKSKFFGLSDDFLKEIESVELNIHDKNSVKDRIIGYFADKNPLVVNVRSHTYLDEQSKWSQFKKFMGECFTGIFKS